MLIYSYYAIYIYYKMDNNMSEHISKIIPHYLLYFRLYGINRCFNKRNRNIYS